MNLAYPRGETHHRARHSAQTVETARQMRDGGASYGAIAKALGVPWNTVRSWVTYRIRASG